MSEKISLPHMPEPQLASCSFKKGFSAPCPLLLHWGFSSRVTAPPSHVLAEQYAGTFHQSADRDGSSGIILTVSPARIRLYGATRPSTHTHIHMHTHALLVKRAFFFLITNHNKKSIMLDRRHANNKHNTFLPGCNSHSPRRLLHRCKHAKRWHVREAGCSKEA